ncbi:dual specificity protein phosphatase family protein [Kutzneria buriramensis]|uniref:Dual specificity protein phosphatase-like protein n=1 Tax=Kutzneria buriramensis TaxID=1045776 RepID=A0A3E0GXZ8_9PSEU|nr:dual specificity protein phosphatase family protein [Kutzneria buriramensis]REH32979.1 dual specificity protein phosphatase-like protein [Kutzneria buriramensis]
MGTSHQDRNIPPPRSPWNEVFDDLWMGGHEYVDEKGELRDAVVTDEFDLVISLYKQPGHGPQKGKRHIVYQIPDGPLTPKQIARLRELAEWTGDRVRMGRKVLIRCHSGYNRSGLLTAQILIELHVNPHAAIELVRRARGRWALNNQIFVDYLLTGLDIAYLLTGLEAPSL